MSEHTSFSHYRLAVAARVESSYRFRCPFCATKLHVQEVGLRDVVACSASDCGGKFQIATKKQLKLEKKEEKREERALQEEIRRLRQSGALPPDRISIFGVSSAGKSVFMAALYHCLWRGIREVSAKVEHGDDHEALLLDYAMLARGEWLDATNRTRASDWAVRFRGIEATLGSMDYPGEVFTDVLYRKRIETEEQRALYEQLQATMAAIILIDPEHVVGGDGVGQRLDVEFTGIEVAEHLRSRGIGDRVAIVLTKRNQNRYLVDRYGGPAGFMRSCLPQLCRAVPGATVMHLSSVGTVVDRTATRRPCERDFDATQVAQPLIHVLKRIPSAHLALLEQLDREGQQAANAAEDDLRRNGVDTPPHDVGETERDASA